MNDDMSSPTRGSRSGFRRWAAGGFLAGIVYITTSLTGTAIAGTGLVLDAEGTITTSSDVVAGAQDIEIRAEGSSMRYRAEVVGEEDGFALLRIVDPPDPADGTGTS